jgi:hypothetical protein
MRAGHSCALPRLLQTEQIIGHAVSLKEMLSHARYADGGKQVPHGWCHTRSATLSVLLVRAVLVPFGTVRCCVQQRERAASLPPVS